LADSPAPLCTAAQFCEGPFGDLASQLNPGALSDMLIEATRQCESECGRRLAPFTAVTETHRCEGMDPDEYADSANLPMDLQGTLGRSYAYALGASTLVRHVWLNEYAPRYPDLWAYGSISITIFRSYGGSTVLTDANYTGPETDSGHIWFQLGQYIPIGSLARVTYGGGYAPYPADLVRAGKYMTAAIIARELQPVGTPHDPDVLYNDALKMLAQWMRP
jgi:hypothetical protein